jgi:C4-type Zn-finger protein
VLPASKAVAGVDFWIAREEVLSTRMVDLRRDQGAISSPEMKIQLLDGARSKDEVS